MANFKMLIPAIIIFSAGALAGHSLQTPTYAENDQDRGQLGACCVSGDCMLTTQSDCSSAGGEWGGVGSGCNFCDRPCCTPSGACLLVTGNQCEELNGHYYPQETTCLAVDCSNVCPADLSGDGMTDVIDLFMLLSQWGECD